MKIIFTGGHHNSALVVAKELIKRGHKVYWFGHKYTMTKETSLSAEYLEVKRAKLLFFEIKTGKFYKNFNLKQWLKIIYGILKSLSLLWKLKPDLIVSFGGYLAVPVVVAGYILKIPSITHEQTTQVGMANSLLKYFVKEVFITWKSSYKYFPKKKTNLIGLPVSQNLFSQKKVKIFKNNLPTIFIIGGKQGSHKINCLIEKILQVLIKKYNIIHQCGRIKKTKDLQRLKKLKSKLGEKNQGKYILKPYFYSKNYYRYLKSADLVVSRAGAHITWELMLLAKPAILIPISWSYKNEQYLNALNLQQMQEIIILDENNIKSNTLLKEIEMFINKIKKSNSIVKQYLKDDFKNARLKMVQKIEKYKE